MSQECPKYSWHRCRAMASPRWISIEQESRDRRTASMTCSWDFLTRAMPNLIASSKVFFYLFDASSKVSRGHCVPWPLCTCMPRVDYIVCWQRDKACWFVARSLWLEVGFAKYFAKQDAHGRRQRIQFGSSPVQVVISHPLLCHNIPPTTMP